MVHLTNLKLAGSLITLTLNTDDIFDLTHASANVWLGQITPLWPPTRPRGIRKPFPASQQTFTALPADSGLSPRAPFSHVDN